MVAGAKDELTKLPLPAAARALVVLAANTHGETPGHTAAPRGAPWEVGTGGWTG